MMLAFSSSPEKLTTCLFSLPFSKVYHRPLHLLLNFLVSEHVTGKISTQVPARTAAEPERKVIEPMKARPEEIQHEKPSVLHADIVQQDSNQVSEDIAEAELTQAPEVITAGDSTRVSANTTMNPEIEAKQQMKSHSDEIQKEPAAPEDNTEADSTNGPAKTTTYPERGVIEPMKAHSKEILHEQPSAVPEDISTVDSTQIPAIEPKKDHAEEIQHEPPFALTEDISKEENIIQEQEVKEPWNDELDQAVQPINEMHNEVLQRDEYTDEKEAEITVPAEQSQKQNETLKDGSTSKELQSEDQMKDEQTEDQELQREEIHGKQPDIQEEQQLDAVNVPEEDAEPQKEKENDKDGKSLLCNSCIFAGSAVMGIIIVFVIQLMRRSNNSKK